MCGTGTLLLSRCVKVDFEKNPRCQFFFFSNHMPNVTDVHSGRDMNIDIISGCFQTDKILNIFTFKSIVLSGAEG